MVNKIKITEDEKNLLEQYQKLPNSTPSLINRLAVEILPPIGFVSIGLYTNQTIWLLALIVLMVIYNIQRVIKQQKNILKLKAISEKIIGTAYAQPKK